MKQILASLALTAVACYTTCGQVISWHDDNGNVIPSTGIAGVAAVTNWNESNPGNNGSMSSLKDNSNNVTTVSFTITGTYGGWGIEGIGTADSDGTYNRTLLAGYANTSSGVSGGVEAFSISPIPYSTYKIIAYFSSDTTNRSGTIACSGDGITYDFSTIGPASVEAGSTAILTQTIDTTGANPAANYAIFTNLSGASETLTLSIPNGGGMAGFQIVNTGSVTNELSLSSDTTASPSTNAYTGSTVTFSADFIGTAPLTNQWEVNTGSGFVPIPGATNSSYTLSDVQATNAGEYALFASNPAGISNSTPLSLTVSTFPTNSLGIDVQFVGSWLDGNCPTQAGSAVIGGGADVWNTVSNPTGSSSVAGTARGTNLVLFDTGDITTPITLDYVADYVFSGAFDPGVNPFVAVSSPVAPLMTGYMGTVTTTSADTNIITLRHLTPGVYDLYCYACGRSDGQTRVDMLFANDQSAILGPNNNSYTLTPGVNYVHLTPTVATNGVLQISFYGTTDAGQGLLNGFQLNGPDTNVAISISSDTTCDSPLNDYVGRPVHFSASFAGFPTPTLQWEVDKGSGYVPIADATNSTLTLGSVQTTDSGNYALFATNAAGGLNSSPLTLSIQSLPDPLAVDVQFDGTTYTGSHATPQVGGAAIGGGSDYWQPVSNPNPVGGDTNPISGSAILLSDVNGYGTPLTLDYAANQDYNNGANTPFDGSGSPAANLMQASLVVLNTNTGTTTIHGLPAGVYDLYLYSCSGNNQQGVVTRFTANDAYDTCGPNATNSTLILETNYVHLTPTVTGDGLLNISFVGRASGQGNMNGIQLDGPGATTSLPVADFFGAPTNILAGQSVVFTDSSSGNITNWVWSFGDGQSITNSSDANISHVYVSAGTYTVRLTVTGESGANASTRTGYITVSLPPTPVFGRPVLSSGSLILSGTGGGSAGAQYRILTTTNLTLPLANWTPVYTNSFAPDGSFGYTNSPLTNRASFFQLVSP